MRRLAAFFAVIAVTLLAVGSSAWAHVSVSPSTATKGGFATLTFQVPNEEENANTTKVQVKFPDDNPIADASVQPVAGWTVAVRASSRPASSQRVPDPRWSPSKREILAS